MLHLTEKAASPYDFLYIDFSRVQIFNSQFDQFGHLTDLTRSSEHASSSSGGVDIKLAKAEKSGSETLGLHKQYDARYLAPLIFLDKAGDLIVRDISKAKLGQFVLAGGKLNVLDLTLIRKAWDLSTVQNLLHKGAQDSQEEKHPALTRQQRRHASKHTLPEHSEREPNEFDLAMDMVRIMPHGIHGTIADDSAQVWFPMREDAFVTQPSDLALNHGKSILGEWIVVGILDAIPDHEIDLSDASADDPTLAMSKGTHSLLGKVAEMVQPMMRMLLGRPTNMYGLTPVLVFRLTSG